MCNMKDSFGKLTELVSEFYYSGSMHYDGPIRLWRDRINVRS